MVMILTAHLRDGEVLPSTISPRQDLYDDAWGHKPKERGYEYALQQYDGTDLLQWYRRSAVYWNPCGPVMRIVADQPTTQNKGEG